jgi:hypothetical protein
MLPYAEIVIRKEAALLKETAIKKIVGFAKITESRNTEKELYTVTNKWEFHTNRTEQAGKQYENK